MVVQLEGRLGKLDTGNKSMVSAWDKFRVDMGTRFDAEINALKSQTAATIASLQAEIRSDEGIEIVGEESVQDVVAPAEGEIAWMAADSKKAKVCILLACISTLQLMYVLGPYERDLQGLPRHKEDWYAFGDPNLRLRRHRPPVRPRGA